MKMRARRVQIADARLLINMMITGKWISVRLAVKYFTVIFKYIEIKRGKE